MPNAVPPCQQLQAPSFHNLRCVDGTIILAEPTPQGFVDSGKFRMSGIPENPPGIFHKWTASVVASGFLILREQDERSARHPLRRFVIDPPNTNRSGGIGSTHLGWAVALD